MPVRMLGPPLPNNSHHYLQLAWARVSEVTHLTSSSFSSITQVLPLPTTCRLGRVSISSLNIYLYEVPGDDPLLPTGGVPNPSPLLISFFSR